jgi:hypothetical protein
MAAAIQHGGVVEAEGRMTPADDGEVAPVFVWP